MTKNYLNAIAAVEQPRQDFIRYLLTAYPLRDPHLRYGFKQLLQKRGNVWQEPYLEGFQPYRPGKSIVELVKQGILHSDLTNLFIPSDRRLYEHQEKAVKAVIQQQNIVVATGTGSGKTECFLIPMLDMLLKEAISAPGVRALILYPMNALVNDQVKRLRKLLSRQQQTKIRFGFYTSRTEIKKDKAIESLAAEFSAYERQELEYLFTAAERKSLNLSTRERLIDEAIEKTQQIQCLSREEIWQEPPHILITNYSMLEHMLIRPIERYKIFAASASTFKMLVVDEAHTYNGSTGSEVSVLLERLKVAVGIETGHIRCIATSASLGDAAVDDQVLKFAQDFFGETFNQVIRGKRVTAIERLGEPYTLPANFSHEEILEYLSILDLPAPNSDVNEWEEQLKSFVPIEQLQAAKLQANGDIHKFLWFALKQHPFIHQLIDIISNKPQRWEQITQSQKLWQVIPINPDGTINDTQTKLALDRLLQLGTLARQNSEDLPLLPVRIHLLFRSLEGLYACVNSECPGVECDPNYSQKPRYGRLYLNEKIICDFCDSPVLELGSCYQCGQAYAFTQIIQSSTIQPLSKKNQGLTENHQIYTLTAGLLDSVSESEELDEQEEKIDTAPQTFIISKRDGWIGQPLNEQFRLKIADKKQFHLAWYPNKELQGCYLQKCAACGARPIRAQAINRFVTYTDECLEAVIDSIFELLPDSKISQDSAANRKVLTFSDGRQDAAFFASAYQRDRTEMIYRQMIWQAFQAVKADDNIATVTQITNKLKFNFLETSIPHPDRDSSRNYLSYCSKDEQSLENERDCQDSAESRAKELLLREFALPFNRRSTLEAYTILACHIELKDEQIELVASQFSITNAEARIFLTVLTDIIRRTGIVSIEGASRYFPETGGVDGVRPEMVDVQGKSKNYLFLEKSENENKKYQDSPSFIPKWKKDGEVSQAQNRLGWYYLKLFGDNFPTREKFQALFQLLQDARLLVPAKVGYHLNWKLLNIIETQQDWYQCNSCQQIIHIPSLSEISQPTINVFGCPAFKCLGTLQPYTHEIIKHATTEHYQQYLIKNRLPLPLRSQEHTAQLGVAELEKRENRFRRGQINMLSCSTTLEMGVDIGELQAVVLRNFPPHVSNYQQRAGRAGRRTDGVAITLMYGQRRPHDRFYFENPEKLIAGSNQIPQLDTNNLQIQQRHIRAELLSAFLLTREKGAEKVTIAEFFNLPVGNFGSSSDFTPPPTAMIYELQEWLQGDDAKSITQLWINRLINKLKSFGNAIDILNQFIASLAAFEQEQLGDWNDLLSPLIIIIKDIASESDRTKRKQLEKRRDGIEAELEKIAKRRLHDELVQASILPIYGFPIDVVRLRTGESSDRKSSQDKHRLERDRRLALGEYAPGQDIVVDDRVYRSIGICRPGDLEKKYYWVCKNCNNFVSNQEGEPIEKCFVCGDEPIPSAAKMKLYKVPKAFTTDWSEPPKVTPYIKPQRQPTSQVFLANDGENPQPIKQPGLYHLSVSQCGTFFLANQGVLGNNKGSTKEGFAICHSCGRDLSEIVKKEREASNKKAKVKKQTLNTHKHPITNRECSGNWYPLIHLGHEFRSDLLKIEFDSATNPILLFGGEVIHLTDGATVTSLAEYPSQKPNGMGFWRSLTYAILAAAAQVIDVPRTELDGLFQPLEGGRAEIIIYDNVPGGAGYSKQIGDRFLSVLEKALKIAETCNCDISCYDCLRIYSNQPFHTELDRHLVIKFLKPLVDLSRT